MRRPPKDHNHQDREVPLSTRQPVSSSAALVVAWKELDRILPAGDPPTVRIIAPTATVVSGELNVALGDATLSARGRVSHVELEVPDAPVQPPEVALGFALVDLGQETDEGRLILAVTPAWARIISELATDSNALYRLTSRQFEELVAGGYSEDGWDVTLTPRSGDGGKDIIATRDDVGAIRVLDQVKLYAPGNLVPANDVRAMWAVLDRDRRASKGYITTTSDFAPGVYGEFADSTPTRLEFRNGQTLRAWLKRILSGARPG